MQNPPPISRLLVVSRYRIQNNIPYINKHENIYIFTVDLQYMQHDQREVILIFLSDHDQKILLLLVLVCNVFAIVNFVIFCSMHIILSLSSPRS